MEPGDGMEQDSGFRVGRRLIYVTVIAAGFALICSAIAFGIESRDVVRAGNLYLVDGGGIFPSRLPRHESAPITARIAGEIGTKDGSHPPAAQTVRVNIDKTIQLDATGLPVCRLGQIQTRATAAAKKACPDAIVGSGEGEVEVAFPEQLPLSSKGDLVLFNGGVRGRTTQLFIHAYVAVPAPTAIIATVKVTSVHDGRYGLHVVAQIPKIAGGSGSVTKFQLNIGRRFSYKGKRESYLRATCPTGHYTTEGEVLFSDGTKLGLVHALPCTPKA